MFATALLATHPKYTTPAQLLDSLLDLYDDYDTQDCIAVHPMQIRSLPARLPYPLVLNDSHRILSFISTWVSQSFEQDYTEKMKTGLRVLCDRVEGVDSLVGFSSVVRPYLISLHQIHNHQQHNEKIKKENGIKEREETLVERKSNTSRASLFLSDLLTKKQMHNLKRTWCELFLDLESVYVARQLTLLDSKILVSIEPQDLFMNVNATKRH
ncbi:UNVERIFIED_CONTAM: hypothetical protein HDU68_009460, partial [Siphonaria sp. JEL0065]